MIEFMVGAKTQPRPLNCTSAIITTWSGIINTLRTRTRD
jgi:hypothetical protein